MFEIHSILVTLHGQFTISIEKTKRIGDTKYNIERPILLLLLLLFLINQG